MKAIIISNVLLLFCCLVTSCQSEIQNDFMEDRVTYRSSQEAIELAIDGYNQLFGTHSRSSYPIKVSDVHSVKSRANRSSQVVPLYYVVNFEDSLGFALISASTRTTPILGIAEIGTCNPNEINADYTLSYLSDLINCFCTSNLALFNRNTRTTSTPLSPCAPKIPVLWGQRYPYGNLFSNHLAGCSNIASAMIMAYYQQPQSMRLSDGTSITLDWSQIRRHIDSSSRCYEYYPNDIHVLLSKLLRQIANDNLSCSDADGTGTHRNNSLRSLNRYGYYCSPLDPFNESSCIYYLQHDYILYMSGRTPHNIEGHDWLMDGFKFLPQEESPNLYSCYFHHNWGADGRYNGYFLSGIFNIQSAYSYDYSCGDQYFDFSYDIRYSAVKYMF